MIVYGSGISDGNRHNASRPADPAGGRRRRHRSRPAVTCNTRWHTPMTNLFLSMLERMEVPTGALGDSTGELHHLSDL